MFDTKILKAGKITRFPFAEIEKCGTRVRGRAETHHLCRALRTIPTGNFHFHSQNEGHTIVTFPFYQFFLFFFQSFSFDKS